MSIIHITDDIKKEFEIHPDGTTSASHRGAARLLGVDRKNIDRNCRGEQMSRSYAEYLAEIGFRGGEHLSNRITDIELSIFAKYYAYKAEEKYRSKQAELVDLAFSAIGARTWIKTELGYNHSQQRSQYDLTLSELVRLALALEIDEIDDRKIVLTGIEIEFWDLPKNANTRLRNLILLENLAETVEIRSRLEAKQMSSECSIKQKGFGGPSRSQMYDAILVVSLKENFAELKSTQDQVNDPLNIEACEEFEKVVATRRIEADKQAFLVG